MCYIVDIVLFEEVDGDDPGTGANDLIYPFAVQYALSAFLLGHDDFSLFLDCLFVSTHTHDQIHMFEHLLGLLEHSRMSEVK